MEKGQAVAALGPDQPAVDSLLAPTLLKAALAANDRLKLALTVLQACSAQAAHPERPAPDLSADIASAGIHDAAQAAWLQELPGSASAEGDSVHLPDLPRLATLLHDDLGRMARPLLGHADSAHELAPELAPRVEHWRAFLAQLTTAQLDSRTLDSLAHGQRQRGDSLHILVMDLHKALNRLASTLATQSIAGAHAWQLAADGSDTPRIEAFMRGLARTKALKLDHPGLDTAATRDGARLLIQNDIGTNDAHVLVLQVDTGSQPQVSTLTYSDLHRQRFAFFQHLLEEVGASWSAVANPRTAGLNEDQPYFVAHARFEAASEDELQRQLEGIGERIVFLIDWNRARKRLLAFVDKAGAVAVLGEAAKRRVGHMAWLVAGGERLVWNAMAAQGAGAFRLGDRLDQVLGDDAAREFLVDVMALATRAVGQHAPPAMVEDEARALLRRQLQGRRGEFDLLQEHAALCHALAQGVADLLARADGLHASPAAKLAARAKAWERQADHLVMRARTLAERQPQWAPMARLLERSDDVADALEEACFVTSLLADHVEHRSAAKRGPRALAAATQHALQALAQAVLAATQHHIQALAAIAGPGDGDSARDHDDFLAHNWRVAQAERQCDELLRSARRALAAEGREHNDAVGLALGTDLAGALESASDALLALGFGVRERVLHRIEAATA